MFGLSGCDYGLAVRKHGLGHGVRVDSHIFAGAVPVLLGTTIHTDILLKSHSVRGVLSRARATRLFEVRATWKEGASNG